MSRYLAAYGGRVLLVALLSLLCAGGAAAQGAPGTWVNAGAYSEMHIVIPDDASPTLCYAAEVFQKYWEASTGNKPGISPFNEGRINVWLGPQVLTHDLLDPAALEGLGNEGFLIRTFTPSRRDRRVGAMKQLIITGAMDQGTLNGVHGFFRRFVGVRWLAVDAVKIRRAKYLMRNIDFRFVPSFEHRELEYFGLWKGDGAVEFRRAHGFRGPVRAYSPNAGTLHLLRAAGKGQGEKPLCLTDSNFAETALEELLRVIRAPEEETPDPALMERRNRLQADADGLVWRIAATAKMSCPCSRCTALVRQENTAAAPLLILANRLAAGIEEALPGKDHRVLVCTQGEQHKPPATFRPRKNVIVQLSTEHCDFSQPLENAATPENAAFLENLAGWAAITEGLWVEDFACHLGNPLQAFPNFHVLQANLQRYDQHGVRGVHVHGWHSPAFACSEFAALRAYLLASLLWDPDFPVDGAVEEFNEAHFGPVADLVNGYIQRVTEAAMAVPGSLTPSGTLDWFGADLAATFLEPLKDVPGGTLTDEQRKRLRVAWLPIRFAVLSADVCGNGDSESLEKLAGGLRKLYPDTGSDEVVKLIREALERRRP